ncbi:MAG: AmmeMemoRadiSam system protein A [Alphaproteobacteria bacterium]
MSSVDPWRDALLPHAATMLDIAGGSIRNGLVEGRALDVAANGFDPLLRAPGACFVSLHMLDDSLRGCIGSVTAARPLIEDIARNAHLAAFEDPRFPPLPAEAYPRLKIEISILSPTEPLTFADEAGLQDALVPGRDGLVLQQGALRGLFLPQVWEALPEPADFMDHLKEKAGLPSGPLASGVQALRFTVISFASPTASIGGL